MTTKKCRPHLLLSDILAYDWRPYNSIRFICRCGRRHTFPRSPAGGRSATSEEKLEDGTRKLVTVTTKEVLCVCGMHTSKDRKGFSGR